MCICPYVIVCMTTCMPVSASSYFNLPLGVGAPVYLGGLWLSPAQIWTSGMRLRVLFSGPSPSCEVLGLPAALPPARVGAVVAYGGLESTWVEKIFS